MKDNNWILDLDSLQDEETYIVCPLCQKYQTKHLKDTYLGQPQFMLGWQAKRLMKECYVAINFPPWPLTGDEAVVK